MIADSGKTKKYNVNIAGISYQLVSGESEEYVRQIASLADQTINRILNSNASLSVSQGTMLAMINFIDALKKTENKLNDCKNKLSEITGEEFRMKMDLNSLREENFEMKKEMIRLNELNKQLVLEIAALRQQEISTIATDENDEIYSENGDEDSPNDEIYSENGDEDLPDDEIKDAVTEKSGDNDIVKDFLEDVEDPFASPETDNEKQEDDNKLFHPLMQQSLDDI